MLTDAKANYVLGKECFKRPQPEYHKHDFQCLKIRLQYQNAEKVRLQYWSKVREAFIYICTGSHISK